MLEQILQNLVRKKKKENVPDFVITNLLREYLQFPVLHFIYNHKKYKNFIFTGGSCLRICHQMPRLSEALDFDVPPSDYTKLNLKKMALDIQAFFKNDFLMDMAVRCQGNKRIYLKFPILKKLDLNFGEGSNILYVKIEPAKRELIKTEIEINPISNFGFNFIVQNYSLKFLMTGKIIAIFSRKWFKGEGDAINIKGRDFYDLFWYFQNNVLPDFQTLSKFVGIKNEQELKDKLWNKIKKNITSQKLSYDLKNFFVDQKFISQFCKNYQTIMKKYLLASSK